MRLRYFEWDEEFFKKLKDFKELLQIFNYLVLQTAGNIEKAFRLMRYLQQQGLIDSGYDLGEFKKRLEEEEIIRREKSKYLLTNKGEKTIRSESLKLIFDNLKKGSLGNHNVAYEGAGSKEYLPEKKRRHTY